MTARVPDRHRRAIGLATELATTLEDLDLDELIPALRFVRDGVIDAANRTLEEHNP